MGDRGVIRSEANDIGIYLHWMGSRDQVEGLLAYCEMKGYRSPDRDPQYGWARLAQVAANVTSGRDARHGGGEDLGLSVGIGPVSQLDTDNWNNGTYIIRGWRIAGREYFRGTEHGPAEPIELLLEIDRYQPVPLGMSTILNRYDPSAFTPSE